MFGTRATCRSAGLESHQLRELAWAVDRVGRFLPKTLNCLPQALALQRMLKRRGARGVIRFGMRKTPEGMTAHAWLVLNEEVLIGSLPHLDEYSAFPEWPA